LEHHEVHLQAKTAGIDDGWVDKTDIPKHESGISKAKEVIKKIEADIVHAKKEHDLHAEFHKAKELWMKTRNGPEPMWSKWKTKLSDGNDLKKSNSN
jgi:hypothetical protein